MPRKYYTHSKKENKDRICDWEGCNEKGEYPAPMSSSNLREYRWFCLKHIRMFNKEWNFFEDKSDKEANDYILNSVYGHRPTWAMGVDAVNRINNAKDPSEEILSAIFDDDWGDENIPVRLPKEIRDALLLFELVYPVTKEIIKKRYKELAKIYHPDLNSSCKESEDKFREITDAYKLLVDSEIFKDL